MSDEQKSELRRNQEQLHLVFAQARQANGDYDFTKSDAFKHLNNQERTNLFSNGDTDKRQSSL